MSFCVSPLCFSRAMYTFNYVPMAVAFRVIFNLSILSCFLLIFVSFSPLHAREMKTLVEISEMTVGVEIRNSLVIFSVLFWKFRVNFWYGLKCKWWWWWKAEKTAKKTLICIHWMRNACFALSSFTLPFLFRLNIIFSEQKRNEMRRRSRCVRRIHRH